MKKKRVDFIWSQFSGLTYYYKKQAENAEVLSSRIAEVISSLTCKSDVPCNVSPELKEILKSMNERIERLHAALPVNAMLIISTGHGDTAIVQRYGNLTTFLGLRKERSG